MSRLTIYGVNTNLNGVNGFGRVISNTIYNTLVGSASDTTLTVPSFIGAGQLATDTPHVLAVFSYAPATTVFVANGASAAPDAGGTFTAKPSMLLPTALLVNGGDTLHFYSVGGTAYVSVEFYSVT